MLWVCMCTHDLEHFVPVKFGIRLPTAGLAFPFGPLTEHPLAPMENCEGKSVKELPYVVACPSSYEVRVQCGACDVLLKQIGVRLSR